MLKRISLALPLLMATPALASEEAWYSMNNTHFVVMIGFVIFLGVVVYYRVPQMVAKLLDDRANSIKSEIEEARALREEAQTILASFERKHKELDGHVKGIIEHAKTEATIAAEAAKEDLKDSIARRLQAAEEQIKSAEQSAIREIKDRAIAISVDAAREVIAAKMTAKDAGALIDDAIKEVGAKLH